MKKASGGGAGEDDEEAEAEAEPAKAESDFTYTPLVLGVTKDSASAPAEGGGTASVVTEAEVLKAVVANDGSFLAKTISLLEQKGKAEAPSASS